MINHAPRRQISGRKPPRTARAQDLQDRVHHLPLGLLVSSATRFGRRASVAQAWTIW
jgi:hypothetical protein